MAHLELTVFFLFFPCWRGASHYYLGVLFLYCRTPSPGATAGAPERENRLIWEHANIVAVAGTYLFREAKEIPRPFRGSETHRT